MKRQLVTSVGSLSVVIAAALLAPASAAEHPGAVPRLADGRPDLQGVWDYRTITPMQRPPELGTKAFFASDEEAAAWERTENRRQDRDISGSLEQLDIVVVGARGHRRSGIKAEDAALRQRPVFI